MKVTAARLFKVWGWCHVLSLVLVDISVLEFCELIEAEMYVCCTSNNVCRVMAWQKWVFASNYSSIWGWVTLVCSTWLLHYVIYTGCHLFWGTGRQAGRLILMPQFPGFVTCWSVTYCRKGEMSSHYWTCVLTLQKIPRYLTVIGHVIGALGCLLVSPPNFITTP